MADVPAVPSVKPWQSKTIVISAVLGALSLAALFWPGASDAVVWFNANGAVVSSIWAGLAIVLRLVSKGSISLSD